MLADQINTYVPKFNIALVAMDLLLGIEKRVNVELHVHGWYVGV